MKNLADSLKKIWPLIKEYKKDLVLLLLFSLIIMISSILTPAFIAKIINCLINKNYHNIIYILLALGIIQLFNLLSNVLSSKLFFRLRKNFIIKLRKKISSSIINLNLEQLSKNGKGKFLQRVNNDPDTIMNCLFDIRKYLIFLLANIGIMIYILYLNLSLGLIYVGSSSIILFIRYIGVKTKMSRQKLYYDEQEKVNSLLTESLNGIKDIKALHLKDSFNEKTGHIVEASEQIQYKASFYFDLCLKGTVLIEWIANSLIILVGAYLLSNNYLIIDSFMTIFMYRGSIFSFSDYFTDLIDKVALFNLSIKRIYEIIDLDVFIINDKDTKECYGSIEFRNVSFSYGENIVLDKCNFSINKNNHYVIVGSSGSGKTTILNLISGLYKVTSGKILIDGVNINKYNESFFKKNISIINQNYYLFDMSIRDNFLLINPKITDKEIIDICKKVKIHNFIMSLPEKYDTIIGEGGYNFSGGQRQRLAIARTLIMNTKIVLFDEVTSSLDKELEQEIFKIICGMKDKTVILVTHKEHLIKEFKNVLILKNGKINVV